MIEKQSVVESSVEGYTAGRIPGLVVVDGDAVLAAVEARPGGGGDYADIDMLLRRSTDGGRSWGSSVKLVDHAGYGEGLYERSPDVVPARFDIGALFSI